MNSFSLSRSGKTIKAPLLALCAALAMTSVSCRAADAPPAKAAPAKPAANVAKQEPIDFFKAGQTWGFLGDSITHGGDYHQHIQLFLATRYPGRDLWTRNFGRSGDSAKAMLRDKRINADLGQNTPDIVFVHLGMNDVGRDGYDNNKQSLPRTKETGNTDFYAERMEEVADRVRELGAKVVILSPTIYDNEGGKEEGRNSRRGLDEQLGVYGEAGGELAARKGYGFIDVHTPMAQLSAEMRKKDVSWSLTRDRVHPDDDGHEIFAYYILKALKPQPYCSPPGVIVQSEIERWVGAVDIGSKNKAFAEFPEKIRCVLVQQYSFFREPIWVRYC